MALIPKIGVNILEESPLTQNINFLSPLGFRFQLNRAPNVEYFCQSATLPTISVQEILQPNPLAQIPRPGDRITYEPFMLKFRVDENMTNYLEIHDWIIGIGHPNDLKQYRDLKQSTGGVYSDGSILILSSNNNPNIRIAFEDMFPLSLSPLSFDVTQSDVEYLEAEVVFRYRQFTVENL
jgi:hypothetical protein